LDARENLGTIAPATCHAPIYVACLVHAHINRLSRQPISADEALDIARTVIIEVEPGLSTLTGICPDLSGFSKAARLHIELAECWNELHPTLEMLKLGGRLAPPGRWIVA
jgi:hypothetical protein